MTDTVPFQSDFSEVVRPSRRDSATYTSYSLDLYQSLIQYFSIIDESGGLPLDLVNFNASLFKPPISLHESESVIQAEHGYASPDGAFELGELIRAYVAARCRRFAGFANDSGLISSRALPPRTAAGVGAGTTGVFHCILSSIKHLAKNTAKSTVLLVVPTYTVYDGIIRSLGFACRHVTAARETDFLVTADQIEQCISDDTVAMVLTFPTNPAQSTYGASDLTELKRIVQLCQANGIYLIVDNIYEDTLWEKSRVNPEVFTLSDSSEYIVKISGPSKDRAGASGWRIGFWVGDPALREPYLYQASLMFNTCNSNSRSVLAIDLILRLANLDQRPVSIDDFLLLGKSVAGWGRPFDPERMLYRFHELRLEEMYWERVRSGEETQASAIQQLKRLAFECGHIVDYVNHSIGNLFLVRIETGGRSAHRFFLDVLREKRLGLLPAPVFGGFTQDCNWFRITTIHTQIERLLSQLCEVGTVPYCTARR